jgi:hypothetical protein
MVLVQSGLAVTAGAQTDAQVGAAKVICGCYVCYVAAPSWDAASAAAAAAAAVAFMVLVRPGLAVTAGALTDPQVRGARVIVIVMCVHANAAARAAAAAVNIMVSVWPRLAVTAGSLTDHRWRSSCWFAVA